MPEKKNIRMTRELVNLTENPVYLYEEVSGNIEEFLPMHWIANPSYDDCGHPRLYYIVDNQFLEKLRKRGRPLDDIVVIFRSGKGRDDVIVSYLESAINSKLKVRYRNYSNFRVA